MKTLIICIIFLAVSWNGIAQYDEQVNWISGYQMAKSADNLIALKDNIQNYYFRNGIVSFLAGFIRKGDMTTFICPLYAGVEYALLAAGDDNATDIDIIITDETGSIVINDVSAAKNAIVFFKPTKTANYNIKVKLHGAITPGCFCNLLVLTKSGSYVSISDVTDAFINAIIASYTAWNANNNIKFYDAAGEWCMYGALLDKGESTQIDNLFFSSKDHLFFAWGDSNTEDVDLTLKNQNGVTVAEDKDQKQIAVFTYSTSSYQKYSLEFKNYNSKGKSVIVTVIMNE